MYFLATSFELTRYVLLFFQGEVPYVSDETHDTADYNTRSRESSTEEQWPKDPLNMSGYHADTPITIKAEASSKADSRIH